MLVFAKAGRPDGAAAATPRTSMSPVPAFFASYQAARRRSAAAARCDRARRRRARDGLHAVRAVEARAPGADAARPRNCAAAPRRRRWPPRRRMELVHTSSLILDDLPAMDDAPLRRGRAANHVEFGEAHRDPRGLRPAQPRLRHARAQLRASALRAPGRNCSTMPLGAEGLIGGQAADLLATEQEIDFELLERIHRGKTGALFNASAVAGALDGRRRQPTRSPRSRPSRRTSASRSRSSTTCSTSRAIPPRPARRRARTRARRRSCRSAASPARTSSRRSCARPPTARWRRSAGAPTACASCRRLSPAAASRQIMPAPSGDDPRVDDLRQRLRSLGYLDAGVDRFVLGSARQTQGVRRLALLASVRVGCARRAPPRPAAALGLSGRVPGLITGPRDAIRRRDLSRRLLRRRDGRGLAHRQPPRLLVRRTIDRPVRQRGDARRRRPARWSPSCCLVYLTLWWQTVIAGLGWSAPLWTLSALALAVAMSLLLGHAVTVAIVRGRARGDRRARADAAGTASRQGVGSWRRSPARRIVFGVAALLFTWTAGAERTADGAVARRSPSCRPDCACASSPSTASTAASSRAGRERARAGASRGARRRHALRVAVAPGGRW